MLRMRRPSRDAKHDGQSHPVLQELRGDDEEPAWPNNSDESWHQTPDSLEVVMNRCCADTLKHYGPRNPVEGLELACRWCSSYLKYESLGPNLVGWVVHDRVGDFVARETAPDAVALRRAEFKRIVGKEPPASE